MHPYYIARAIGGAIFLAGTSICLYNIVMTIREAPGEQQASADTDAPLAARVPAE
jgi:cytochrome c oxidase cbb3-type subunit 1